MSWRNFIRDYLTFTRRERIGILTTVCIIIFVWFSPRLFSSGSPSKIAVSDTAWLGEIKKLEQKKGDTNEENDNPDNYSFQKTENRYFNKGELFYFDPNTLSTEDWLRLGIRERTVQTIQNYLSKGGHFYRPDDLQKIYGLKKEEYERLKPFIRIGQKAEPKRENNFNSQPTAFTKERRYEIIDINTADTTAFIALPGIGSKLAARIVNFREKLGGFYSIEQVGETYGVPDSTFQKIRQYLKLENTSVKKININTASVAELKAHPYISYSIANPLVAYRNQHGFFSKVEDIKKVFVITEEVYEKISPYMSVE